jgi:hypothetical protein
MVCHLVFVTMSLISDNSEYVSILSLITPIVKVRLVGDKMF